MRILDFAQAKEYAWIVVTDDAVPFIKQGRNVMHGFVDGVDKWLRPNENVLIVDTNGNLVGFGRSNSTVAEMASSTKGIAVKTREGIR